VIKHGFEIDQAMVPLDVRCDLNCRLDEIGYRQCSRRIEFAASDGLCHSQEQSREIICLE
jgi:hypothetical protein